jgi:hypothetical protein
MASLCICAFDLVSVRRWHATPCFFPRNVTYCPVPSLPLPSIQYTIRTAFVLDYLVLPHSSTLTGTNAPRSGIPTSRLFAFVSDVLLTKVKSSDEGYIRCVYLNLALCEQTHILPSRPMLTTLLYILLIPPIPSFLISPSQTRTNTGVQMETRIPSCLPRPRSHSVRPRRRQAKAYLSLPSGSQRRTGRFCWNIARNEDREHGWVGEGEGQGVVWGDI